MSERRLSEAVWVLVSNDLTHDQRVLKTCQTLRGLGFAPQLVGREMPSSVSPPVDFPSFRLRLPFHSGALFYAALQLALVRYLWRRTKGTAGIWANDLDTLLPAFVVARLRRLPLMYDSHELFTEAAGLTGRPLPRGVWLFVERLLVPRLRAMTTVNDAIADTFASRYPKGTAGRPLVVRNMPRGRRPEQEAPTRAPLVSAGLALTDGPLGILQGAFLDADRGVKEAVEVLEVRPRWQLLVVGAGPEWDWAKQQVPRFSGRLHVIPKQPYALLAGWTRSADWGFSLDKPVHGNYIMSLPNKLFDYIHAGLPVVASALPEVQKVVERHQVGALIRDHSPEAIATAVEQVLDAPRETWLARCATAAEVLNWEAEEPVIREALHRSGFISPRRRRA